MGFSSRSMNFCERIPLHIDLTRLITQKELLKFKSYINGHQKYSVALKRRRNYDHASPVLHVMDETSTRLIREQLPLDLLALEVPEVVLLSVTPDMPSDDLMFPPHVDKIRVCCINVYLEPHEERTIYYKYNSGEMREVESFVAQDNECWVLDTTVPHAVQLSYPHSRRMVSASFVHTPFETVRKLMLNYANRKMLCKVDVVD